MTRPVAIDLFAGAGGLALGFEQAGFDLLAAAEYDPVHAAVHSYNFPHTTMLCADMAQVQPDHILRAASDGWSKHSRPGLFDGKVDVIFGGPPCQGFSTIGRRLVDDERNQLVFHFFRLVTEIRPRFFVMENVPGMALGKHSGILEQLVEEFAESGYHVTQPVRVLNAAAYGVPQDRRRLFLLGSRDGEPMIEYPRAKTSSPDGRRGIPKGFSERLSGHAVPVGPTVWDAIGDLPDLDSFAELIDSDVVRLSESQLRALDRKCSGYVQRLRGQVPDPEDLSYARAWDPRLLTGSLRTIHTPISVERFSRTVPGDVEPISRFYRLPQNGLSNTLRAGTGGERGAYTSPRPIHPTLPRVISVREAARLHSFPDWFRLHQTKWHGFRQVGNAVPPLLARAVAEQVVISGGWEPEKPGETISLGDPALLALAMSQAAADLGAETLQMPKPRSRTNGSAPSASDTVPGNSMLATSETRARGEGTRYARLLEQIFQERFSPGCASVAFAREDIEIAAQNLGIQLPKNLGDLIYSFRYRVDLPESIRAKAPPGKQWVIRPAGRSRYSFEAVDPGAAVISPNRVLTEAKVPDATPGVVAMYALNDEQALLAILRYNRLIDVFTGVASYSLQSHLRTTVPSIGQVGTDEIYVGVDKRGAHYVFPVQAKGGRDNINVVQIEQDFALCAAKFPGAICRPIAAQFMEENLIALFEFEQSDDRVAVSSERHYRLVPHEDVSQDDLRTYRARPE